MLANEFEAKLVAVGFYFKKPSVFVPGSDKDAEYYTAEDIMDILVQEGSPATPRGGFRKMVRKRFETTNTATYYFKDEKMSEYFKVVVPTSIAGGMWLDIFALRFTLKQAGDTIKVRLGMW